MVDIQSFKKEVQSLVSKFNQDKNHYRSKGYNEAQVRINFLTPLCQHASVKSIVLDSAFPLSDIRDSLVDRMLDLHKQKAALPRSAEREKSSAR